MSIDNLTTLIANYGFPIVCCIAMFWYITIGEKRHKQERERVEEKHKEEVDKLSETVEHTRATLENNTEIMKELKTMMETFITLTK